MRNKTNNPNGRPKKFGERRTITLSIDLSLLGWLEGISEQMGVSRNECLCSHLKLAMLRGMSGKIRYSNDGSGQMRDRLFADPEFFIQQIEAEGGVVAAGMKELLRFEGGESITGWVRRDEGFVLNQDLVINVDSFQSTADTLPENQPSNKCA